MAKGRHSVHRSGWKVLVSVVATSILAAVGLWCTGMSFATATDSEASMNSFGLSHTAQVSTVFTDGTIESSPVATAEDAAALTATAPRDITRGIDEITAEEQAAEQEAIDRANEHKAAYLNTYGALPAGDVDFSVGKEEFIKTWTDRINAYLKGFPLAGHGEDFARAAWDNGVDPRWSPAISNTESTRGSVCFLPHNAWGWGASSWGSWSEAIQDYVSGLAKGYAFTIAYSLAQKYCPPNYDNWYRDTLAEMQKI